MIAEIMHSDKWQTKILEKMHGLERMTIKDPNYESEACIEIWQHEIHIRTAWSNYTYRIFTRGNAVWCEYIGAYRGLLEQKLLPSLTPKMNILDSEVVESSLTGNKRQTLRTYSSENLKLKNFRRDNFKEEYNVTSPQDHPTVVYDHKKKALGFRTKCFLFVVICHFRQYLYRSVSKVPAMKLSHCHKFWFIDRQVYVK